MLVFFAFITVFTDYKQSKLSDGLDPHFEIPLQTLETEGGGVSTEVMDECSIKIWNRAGGDRGSTSRFSI